MRPATVGFDTATEDTAVCASAGGGPLFEESIGTPDGSRPLHATALLPAVERAADAAGGWSEVGAIAVGVGPGSYTGVRIGIATAKALAGALDVPVRGVCTLDAIGHGTLEASGARPVLAVLDARRGEVFAALYDPGGARTWDPFVVAPAELASRLSELPARPLGAGSGALRFHDQLAGSLDIPERADPVHRVAARQICRLSATAGAGPAEPIYLRAPDADRWLERNS